MGYRIGQTRPTGEALDLMALVAAVRRGRGEPERPPDPEHLSLLRMCRRPASVADVAADLDLPVGVMQVLLADLCEWSLRRTSERSLSPAAAARSVAPRCRSAPG